MRSEKKQNFPLWKLFPALFSNFEFSLFFCVIFLRLWTKHCRLVGVCGCLLVRRRWFSETKNFKRRTFRSFFIPAWLMNFCDNSWKVGGRRHRAFTGKASLQSDTIDVTIVSSQTVLLSLKRLQRRKNFATTSTDVPPKGCSFTIPVRRVYFRGTCFLLSLLNRFLCYQTSVPIPSLQRSAVLCFASPCSQFSQTRQNK